MGRTAVPSQKSRRVPPARTPEEREHQMIALAMDTAEARMRNNTASAAEICHFLKLGTTLAELEKEKLKKENQLLEAKTDAIQSGRNVEALYAEAIASLKSYKGELSDDV